MSLGNETSVRTPVCLPIPEAMILWPHDLGSDLDWDAMTPLERRLHGIAVGVAMATLVVAVAVAALGGA